MLYRKEVFGILLACTLSCSPALSQTATIEVGALESMKKGANSLVEWFKSLSTSLSPITSSLKKKKLTKSFSDLHKDLYNLESNTNYLIEALSRKRLNNDEINGAIRDLEASLKQSASQIAEIGPDLSLQLAKGGNDAAEEINLVLYTRGVWLSNLRGNNFQKIDKASLDQFVKDGKEIRKSLNSARVELITVIEKIGKD